MQSLFVGNMHYQRIAEWTSHSGKNTFYCLGLQCISPKSIDGLRGKNNNFACPQQGCCMLNFLCFRMNWINATPVTP